jgi:hypothetical protein
MSRHHGILNLIMIEEFEERLHMQLKRNNRRLKWLVAQTVAQPIDSKYFMTRFHKPRNDLNSAHFRREWVHLARSRTNSDYREGGQLDLEVANQPQQVSHGKRRLFPHILPIPPT